MILHNLFNISQTGHLSCHYSFQISINSIFKDSQSFRRNPSSLGMPVHILANCENSISWQLWELKVFLKVMRQKGKADASEEQGEMSRELVYLLGTLKPEDEGGMPVHCLMKAKREGSSWLLTKGDLEKELDHSHREEELQHRLEAYKIHWYGKIKETSQMCWKNEWNL